MTLQLILERTRILLDSFIVTKIDQKEDRYLFNYDYLTANKTAIDFLHILLLDAGLQSLLLLENIFKTEFEEIRISKMLKQLPVEIDNYRRENSKT